LAFTGDGKVSFTYSTFPDIRKPIAPVLGPTPIDDERRMFFAVLHMEPVTGPPTE
jgi:hypothetical protein